MPRVDTQEFYQAAIDLHGTTAEGVHWNSRRTQECRFDALRALLPEDISALTLADIGCGFGDLHQYLARNQDLPGCYIGIDALESMVSEARERTGADIHLLDALADPLPQADYYLCSGAMNTLTKYETYCFIERCFAASHQGFVFNLLRGRDDEADVFNCRHPDEVRQWAEQLGAGVAFREGYLRNDFSVAMTRLSA
ncbi:MULTISPECIES: class I SAM-dependent methyltransferase [Thiorhodovibrio]|uniref:class I SAM-dependent methyltransferase n=1 Tax=Thiorhodovibrio TaxID=61593 RepID=UPI0019146569|nr:MULTISPECIES: class I SAM-dependent methyltransferase [Thiorhodovibrio]MBK5969857.1 methyltransferase type 11 [Thiorhodovibrio winogradskyi]WPL12099.1 Methyltransferase domain protein [Thiorhodovibrio litoralis]